MIQAAHRGAIYFGAADIVDCFNQVDSGLLQQFLRANVPSEMLRLVQIAVQGDRPADAQRGLVTGFSESPVLLEYFLRRAFLSQKVTAI